MTEEENAWKTYKIVMTIVTFALIIFGVVLGFVNYNYQIDKCNNMDRQISDYDFDHTVEVDARFNQNCFYYQNHPLAFIGEILGWGIVISLMSVLGWFPWAMYLDYKWW